MSKFVLKNCTPCPLGETVVFLREFQETLLKNGSSKTTQAALLGQLVNSLESDLPGGDRRVVHADPEPVVGTEDTVAERDGERATGEAPTSETGINERSSLEGNVEPAPTESNKKRIRKRSAAEHGIDEPQGMCAGVESPSTAAHSADISPQGKEVMRKKKKVKVEVKVEEGPSQGFEPAVSEPSICGPKERGSHPEYCKKRQKIEVKEEKPFIKQEIKISIEVPDPGPLEKSRKSKSKSRKSTGAATADPIAADRTLSPSGPADDSVVSGGEKVKKKRRKTLS